MHRSDSRIPFHPRVQRGPSVRTLSRMVRTRLLPLLFAALTACVAVPDDSGPLVAVSNMQHPPFSSWDETATAVGMEVEIVAAAARRLGRDVIWLERPFGELLDAVATGEADLAAATIGITEERARLVDFSKSYYETPIVALVRPGQREPRSLTELAGRRIATERHTTAVGAANLAIPQAIRVLDRPDERTWAELLAAGDVDAVILDRSSADKFMTDAGREFHIVTEPLRTEHFGIAVRKGSGALKAALDTVIAGRSPR